MPCDGAAAHAAAAFSVGGEPDHAVLHGLYWLAAGLGPLAIVVDDAHWLDRPSLRWLAYMVNRVADLPLALILAARSDEPDELLTPDRPAPVDDRARRRSRSPPAAVAELAGEERAAAVYEATGGNPFYVHALLADEDGTPRAVVDVDRAAARARCPPPCTRARPRDRRRRRAAGRSPRALAGLDVRDTVEAAEALAAADILRGDGFAHPLVAAGRLRRDPGRRARRAARRGRAAASPAPERVAAQRDGRRPGRRRLGGAGAARRRRAPPGRAARPDVAAAFLRRAAEEELPRDELVPLLRELARALIAVEGPGGFPVLREALALAPGAEREEIALELGRALFAQGYFTDAAAVFERGRERGGARSSSRRSPCSTSRWSRRSAGSTRSRARLPPGASAVGAWIEVARRPPAATGADHAEEALAERASRRRSPARWSR